MSNGADFEASNSTLKTFISSDSSVTVTVSGSYGTTLGSNAGSISSAFETLASARASFDALYATSTAWGTNTRATGATSSTLNALRGRCRGGHVLTIMLLQSRLAAIIQEMGFSAAR